MRYENNVNSSHRWLSSNLLGKLRPSALTNVNNNKILYIFLLRALFFNRSYVRVWNQREIFRHEYRIRCELKESYSLPFKKSSLDSYAVIVYRLLEIKVFFQVYSVKKIKVRCKGFSPSYVTGTFDQKNTSKMEHETL